MDWYDHLDKRGVAWGDKKYEKPTTEDMDAASRLVDFSSVKN